MIAPAARERLHALVSAEVAALEGFVELLRQELEALRGADSEHLGPLAESKDRAADELRDLSRARNRELAQTGLPLHARGIELLAERVAHDAEIGRVCARWLVLARQARDLNQINGKQIQTRLTAHRQALSALRGAGDRHGVLYGPDGLSNHATLRHHIASG